jgi:hypothetical protein
MVAVSVDESPIGECAERSSFVLAFLLSHKWLLEDSSIETFVVDFHMFIPLPLANDSFTTMISYMFHSPRYANEPYPALSIERKGE